MKLLLIGLMLAGAVVTTAANADMLERQAARYIRKSGNWCDHVGAMGINKAKSTTENKVVVVVCYDRIRMERYELVVGPDNKVKSLSRVDHQ